MKFQPVKPFKDNLKRMLLKYSLLPAVGVMVCAVIFATIIGGVLVSRNNKAANGGITEQLEQTFSDYAALLTELSNTEGIVDLRTSLTKRQRIVRRLYQTSVDTGYKAELYIVDQEFNVCVSTDVDVSGNLGDQADKKWSILKDLEESDGELRVSVKSVGSNPTFYMGLPVVEAGTRMGYLIVTFRSKEFIQLLSNPAQSSLLVDDTGWVFAAGHYTFIDAVGRLIPELKEQRGFFSYGRETYYLSTRSVYQGALELYTITNLTDAVIVLQTVIGTGIFVLLLVFLIELRSTEKLADKSTRDILKLNDGFKQVMEGDLEVSLDICSSTEFEHIGRCFNEMLSSLKHQIAANRELAETVAYEQVKRLESQFNTHFLFNTLDNIRFMCKIDADLAEFMAISLSDLLRYNTSNANQKVTVEEDISHIRIYLEIIHVRFRERFDFRIEIDEEIKDYLMPKLLLQPLIENAIKYGFGDREHLNLKVSGYQSGGVLRFICQDDGVGIEPELLEKIRHNLSLPDNESSHLGLYNVHRRLQLMYGIEYGMQIESEQGVRISLSLPGEGVETQDAEAPGPLFL